MQASDVSCEVRFALVREDFTVVKWFYDGLAPVALQHGLRMRVLGTGSIGRFSWMLLGQSIVLGFGAFGIAQGILDQYWYYFHSGSNAIAPVAFRTLRLGETETASQPLLEKDGDHPPGTKAKIN
jgi:hypothetical protein